MNNIRKIIEERLENARNDFDNNLAEDCLEETNFAKLYTLHGQIEAYQDCLNLIDEYTPKIVTKQLSVKEIETLLQDLNKPHQFIIDKPAPRTEADILKDFELLGLVIAKNDDFELILIDDCDRMIAIYKTLKRYDCYYFSEGYKPLQLSTDITMQEHKLLHELFSVWGWI